MQKRKRNRVIAIVLAAVLATSALAIGLSNTFAAKPDTTVALERKNTYPTIAVGATEVRGTVGGRRVNSAIPAIATASINGGNGDVTMTGVKAGVAYVTVGSGNGNQLPWQYQIVDNSNIAGYTLKQGGEVYLKAKGETRAVGGYLTNIAPGAAAANSITWRSLQPEVAKVSDGTNGTNDDNPDEGPGPKGTITAMDKGAAIIVGTFTDKWGIDRDLHILVTVGIKNGPWNDLLEWVNKGQAILDLPASETYKEDGVEALEDAVSGGRDILNKEDPTEQEILDAIQDIKDAIDGLEAKPRPPADIFGPDSNGDYYKPVGDPPNVYEVVDENGNSKTQPPTYIYDDNSDGDGDPSTGNNNHPAEKNDGNYYVEYPENIWHKVKGDGTLQDEPALWGGPDGKPGGGDDRQPVFKFGNDWWVDCGQNVWQKVNASSPRGPLGPLTGGGPDRNPATDPVTPIYEHSDGRYFVGPLGDPGHEYYYGNPPGGGDGCLDSTAEQLFGDDVVWYKDSNGNMTTTPPVGDGDPEVADDNGNGGRVLTPEQTGDTVDWIEIARSGAYSLIVRKSYINAYTGSGHYGDPTWQIMTFGTDTNYIGSTTQSRINGWFKTLTTVANGDNLPSDARLRDYTMQNDATTKLGKGSTVSGLTNAFSMPTTFPAGDGDNVAFALSYTEVAKFCSITHDVRGMNPEMQPSSNAAKANFNKLSGHNQDIWLRTPGDINGTVGILSTKTGDNGRAFQMFATSDQALTYPALWVKSTIFTDPVTPPLPSIPGLDANQPSVGGTVKIDNQDWLVVRRKTVSGENFVYLLSKTSQGYGQNFHDTSSNYEGSKLQGRMTSKFSGSSFPTIKQVAVIPTLGTHSSNTATSEPTAILASAAGTTKDIFFAPSLKDAQNGRTVFNSVLLANPKRFWLRTSDNSSAVWDWLGGEDREASALILGTNIDDMIGVWVKVA